MPVQRRLQQDQIEPFGIRKGTPDPDERFGNKDRLSIVTDALHPEGKQLFRFRPDSGSRSIFLYLLQGIYESGDIVGLHDNRSLIRNGDVPADVAHFRNEKRLFPAAFHACRNPRQLSAAPEQVAGIAMPVHCLPGASGFLLICLDDAPVLGKEDTVPDRGSGYVCHRPASSDRKHNRQKNSHTAAAAHGMDADRVEAVRINRLVRAVLADIRLQDIGAVRADLPGRIRPVARVDPKALSGRGVSFSHNLSPGLQELPDFLIGRSSGNQSRPAHEFPKARTQEHIDFIHQKGLHAHIVEIHRAVQILFHGDSGFRRATLRAWMTRRLTAGRAGSGRLVNLLHLPQHLRDNAFPVLLIQRQDFLGQSGVFQNNPGVKPHRLFPDPGVSSIHVEDEIPVREKDILIPEPSFSYPDRDQPRELLFAVLPVKAEIAPGIQENDDILLPERVQEAAYGKCVRLFLRLLRQAGSGKVCRFPCSIRLRRFDALHFHSAVRKRKRLFLCLKIIAFKSAVIDEPNLAVGCFLFQRGLMDKGERDLQRILGERFKKGNVHAEGMNGAQIRLFQLRKQFHGKIVPVARPEGVRKIIAADNILPEDAPKIADRGGGNREGSIRNPVQQNCHQLRGEPPANRSRLREEAGVIHGIVRVRLEDQRTVPEEKVGADLVNGDLILQRRGIQI